MPTRLEMASWLTAGKRREGASSGASRTSTVKATALEDSAGGTVLVDLGGDVVSEANSQYVEVPTTADVRASDSVLVTLNGADGTAKAVTATGAIGGGDRTREEVRTVSSAVDTVSTTLTQETSYFEASINTVSETLTTRADSTDAALASTQETLASEISERRSYMRFEESGGSPMLALGSSDSPAQMRLTNTQLQFLYQQEVMAYMSSDALHIANADVTSALTMGDWAVVPRSNGNLSVKWMGGDS